jgi:hypothetical protein
MTSLRPWRSANSDPPCLHIHIKDKIKEKSKINTKKHDKKKGKEEEQRQIGSKAGRQSWSHHRGETKKKKNETEGNPLPPSP